MSTNVAELMVLETDERVRFVCPGCKCNHAVVMRRFTSPGGPLWTWNEDLVSPTFSPSIFITYDQPIKDRPAVCHSFVTAGRIRFLDDSTHALAGREVAIQPLTT